MGFGPLPCGAAVLLAFAPFSPQQVSNSVRYDCGEKVADRPDEGSLARKSHPVAGPAFTAGHDCQTAAAEPGSPGFSALRLQPPPRETSSTNIRHPLAHLHPAC